MSQFVVPPQKRPSPPSRPNQPAVHKDRRMRKEEFAARFAQTPAATATEADHAKQRALFDRHDSVVYQIRLPLGPTVNQYFQIGLIGRHATMFIGAAGKAYREAVAKAWVSNWKGCPPDPLTGRLRMLVTLSFQDRRANDLDNRMKPLQDAMTKAGVWQDDSQIDDLRILRGPVCQPVGYCDVTIETIPE